MPTISWAQGTDGDWGSRTLWNPATTPNDPTADVVIDATAIAGSYTIAVAPGATFTVNSLILDPGSTNSGIADNGTLLANGLVTIENGILDVAGALSAASVDVEQGLTLAGGTLSAADLTIGQAGFLSGFGTVAASNEFTEDGFLGVSGGSLTVIAGSFTVGGGNLDAASGTLTLQAGSFSNLSGTALTGGNYEADNGGVLTLPENAGIASLQGADLFLLGDGTVSYFDTATGATQAIQAGLATIDSLSAIQIVGGATFVAQNTLLLDGRVDLVNGVLGAPGLTVSATGLLFGVGIVSADDGVINNGKIISGTGIASSLGNAAGDLTIIGAVQGTGDLVSNVGTLELATGSTEAVTLIGGSTLRVDAPIAPGGTLYTGAITTSSATAPSPATIDLPNLAFAGLTTNYADVPGGAVIDVESGAGVVAELDFAGVYKADAFTLADDGAGGIDLVVACYGAGTPIRTVMGEVAIEELRPGDLLITVGGETLPITWLGYRHVRCHRHREPTLVWPVRVRAGAFDEAMPRHDLWLSPDHAVFCGGVLIPVKHLINGHSVTQVPVDAITYWHVELSRHDVILAANLPAESYLDTGNRAMFSNGAAHLALHPDFTARGWDNACTRLVTEGAEVAAVRRRLRKNLKKNSFPYGTGDLMELRRNGRVFRPARSHGSRHCFLLPAGPGTVQIELESGSRIDGIVVDGRVLHNGDPAVISGLACEGDGPQVVWRCVDDTAELLLPPGSAMLEIILAKRSGGQSAPIAA